jgi:hypothetical protein
MMSGSMKIVPENGGAASMVRATNASSHIRNNLDLFIRSQNKDIRIPIAVDE